MNTRCSGNALIGMNAWLFVLCKTNFGNPRIRLCSLCCGLTRSIVRSSVTSLKSDNFFDSR